MIVPISIPTKFEPLITKIKDELKKNGFDQGFSSFVMTAIIHYVNRIKRNWGNFLKKDSIGFYTAEEIAKDYIGGKLDKKKTYICIEEKKE